MFSNIWVTILIYNVPTILYYYFFFFSSFGTAVRPEILAFTLNFNRPRRSLDYMKTLDHNYNLHYIRTIILYIEVKATGGGVLAKNIFQKQISLNLYIIP